VAKEHIVTNDPRPHVLIAVAPHVGGRGTGTAVSGLLGPEVRTTVVESIDEDPAALADATAALTGLVQVDVNALAKAPRLRFVQCASHGFDYVDIAAAIRQDVLVSNIGSSDAEREAVAEHTFALLLALAKQLVPGHLALVSGEWARQRLSPSVTELGGKTLGVIGFGAIGAAVARRAAAFGMTILYSGPRAKENNLGARHVELAELLATADFVTLHTHSNDETRHLLDATRLALLKPTAIVVNTSRAALIDQDALADALESGRIAGAGLDVFDPEPPTARDRLLHLPDVVLSPHIAGGTRESSARIVATAVANITRFLAGQRPQDVVSKG
jgi:phosphoglycerate dehydrogenase-like enzyme